MEVWESLIKFSTSAFAGGKHRLLTSLIRYVTFRPVQMSTMDRMSTINWTVKSRSSQLTKRDEVDPTIPESRPADYKSVPQLFYLQSMNLKRSDDKKLSVNAEVPRPLAATHRSADYRRNRNCRGKALSIDSTQHLLNYCRYALTLADYRVVV